MVKQLVTDERIKIDQADLEVGNGRSHAVCFPTLLKLAISTWFQDWTPLCIAAQNGHAETVQLLLSNKADVNKANHIVRDFAAIPPLLAR